MFDTGPVWKHKKMKKKKKTALDPWRNEIVVGVSSLAFTDSDAYYDAVERGCS